MRIIIYTSYDCLIKVGQQNEVLSENEHLVIESPKENIAVFPTGKTSRYSFYIDLENETSPYYRIVKDNGDVLIFLLDGFLSENVETFSFEYNQKESFVEIGKNQIVFKSENHQKIISLPFQTKSVKCGNFSHINYVSFGGGGKSYLIAYNTKNGKTKLFQGDEIETNENGIIVTNEKNNFYKKVVEEYFVDKDGLKSKSKVFSPKDNIQGDMLGYCFMSSIKFKDYQNAFKLLHSSLQEKVDENSLKNYFGDVSYFYMIDSSSCFALSNGENKIYQFKITDNKIIEISDN